MLHSTDTAFCGIRNEKASIIIVKFLEYLGGHKRFEIIQHSMACETKKFQLFLGNCWRFGENIKKVVHTAIPETENYCEIFGDPGRTQMCQKNLKQIQLTQVHLDHGALSITFCIPWSAVLHSSSLKLKKKNRLK